MDRYFHNDVVGIVETDAKGRIVRVNECIRRMLGFPEDEMLQMSWSDLAHPQDASAVAEHFAPLNKGEGTPVLEMKCRGKRGYVPVSVNVHAGQSDESGLASHYVAFVMDLTHQRKIESDVAVGERQLEHLRSRIGKALGDALEARDPYTSGHQDQVAKIAGSVGQVLGLVEHELRLVIAAASVHDIGKIGIPNEYLARPGKLDALEWAVIQTHARKGYDILKPLETEFPVAEIVYQHHERLDGSGYPRGLKGQDLLREAQIVAVADMADSVVNPRPYRRALGKDFALEILAKERGVKFFEDITDACATVIPTFPWRS